MHVHPTDTTYENKLKRTTKQYHQRMTEYNRQIRKMKYWEPDSGWTTDDEKRSPAKGNVKANTESIKPRRVTSSQQNGSLAIQVHFQSAQELKALLPTTKPSTSGSQQKRLLDARYKTPTPPKIPSVVIDLTTKDCHNSSQPTSTDVQRHKSHDRSQTGNALKKTVTGINRKNPPITNKKPGYDQQLANDPVKKPHTQETLMQSNSDCDKPERLTLVFSKQPSATKTNKPDEHNAKPRRKPYEYLTTNMVRKSKRQPPKAYLKRQTSPEVTNKKVNASTTEFTPVTATATHSGTDQDIRSKGARKLFENKDHVSTNHKCRVTTTASEPSIMSLTSPTTTNTLPEIQKIETVSLVPSEMISALLCASDHNQKQPISSIIQEKPQTDEQGEISDTLSIDGENIFEGEDRYKKQHNTDHRSSTLAQTTACNDIRSNKTPTKVPIISPITTQSNKDVLTVDTRESQSIHSGKIHFGAPTYPHELRHLVEAVAKWYTPGQYGRYSRKHKNKRYRIIIAPDGYVSIKSPGGNEGV